MDLNNCAQCGKERLQNSLFCSYCGTKLTSQPVAAPLKLAGPDQKSSKSPLVALLLCLFFGSLGLHRFYVGKIATGILMLLTLGGLGVWAAVDLIRIICNDFEDSKGKYLEFPPPKKRSPLKTIVFIIGLGILGFVVLVMLIISLALFITSGVTDTVNDQLAALRAGDYTKAYTYTSKEFKTATSFDEFKQFVQYHPALYNNKNSTFTQREVKNDDAMLKGTLEAKDGSILPIEYYLIKENNKWKIIFIKIPSRIEPIEKQATPIN